MLQRKDERSNNYNKMTPYKLMKLGDVEIVLIENYPCHDRYELLRRERETIEASKELAINKCKPLNIAEENEKAKQKLTQDRIKYQNDNREELNKKHEKVEQKKEK